MRTLWIPALLVVLAVGCTPPEPAGSEGAPAGNSSNTTAGTNVSSTEGAETTLVSLNIPGMTWAGCAMEVEKTLSPLPGVVDIKTDPIKKTAVIKVNASEFDSNAAIEKLAAAEFENSTVAN